MNTESVKIFPNEETFQRIYTECLDKQPTASEAIKTNYQKMDTYFEEYIAAIEEHTFRYAYQCGYEAAQKGGTAV